MRKNSKETQQARVNTKRADEDPNALYHYASPPCFMHEFATWEAEPSASQLSVRPKRDKTPER
jgi:hypothetical protein